MLHVAIILVVVALLPVIIANWVAARAYPLPATPMTSGTMAAVLEKRLALAHRLTLAFFAIIIGLALVGQLANL